MVWRTGQKAFSCQETSTASPRQGVPIGRMRCHPVSLLKEESKAFRNHWTLARGTLFMGPSRVKVKDLTSGPVLAGSPCSAKGQFPWWMVLPWTRRKLDLLDRATSVLSKLPVLSKLLVLSKLWRLFHRNCHCLYWVRKKSVRCSLTASLQRSPVACNGWHSVSLSTFATIQAWCKCDGRGTTG